MRTVLALIAAFFALPALASPSVQATVVTGTASCGFYVDSAPVLVVPATGTTCTLDVGNISTGAHSVQADARSVADPIWGTQTSAKSPALNFTRPAAPAAPTTLQLVP